MASVSSAVAARQECSFSTPRRMPEPAASATRPWRCSITRCCFAGSAGWGVRRNVKTRRRPALSSWATSRLRLKISRWAAIAVVSSRSHLKTGVAHPTTRQPSAREAVLTSAISDGVRSLKARPLRLRSSMPGRRNSRTKAEMTGRSWETSSEMIVMLSGNFMDGERRRKTEVLPLRDFATGAKPYSLLRLIAGGGGGGVR